jgi:hypothetical protein
MAVGNIGGLGAVSAVTTLAVGRREGGCKLI